MKLPRSIFSGLALTTILCFGQAANAAIIHFIVPLSGAQEVLPATGDPDGMGLANLYIDDVGLTIRWDIVVSGILLPLTGAHIHSAAAGINGPVVVNFLSQLSGMNLFDTDLAGVLTSPANFYVNLHNAEFQGGALRGQLSAAAIPEPAMLGLFGLGLTALVLGRRRTHASA